MANAIIATPAQLIAYAMGALALGLALRPSGLRSRIIGAVLVAFWLWNGVVYHWLYFVTINFAAPLFAASGRETASAAGGGQGARRYHQPSLPARRFV